MRSPPCRISLPYQKRVVQIHGIRMPAFQNAGRKKPIHFFDKRSLSSYILTDFTGEVRFKTNSKAVNQLPKREVGKYFSWN